MKIQYYKTNHGTFFKSDDISSYSLHHYIINGIEGNLLPKYNSFYLVKEDILIVQVKKQSARKWNGWKLKNPALESSILPLTLEQSKIVEDWNDDNEKVYEGDFGDYHSLYEQDYINQPSTIEDVELTLICLGELQITNLDKPEDTKVSFCKGGNTWAAGSKAQVIDLSAVVTYDALASLVVPDFMLHNHPCSISSKQVYEIVRGYVKENINLKAARITSDYDFCFTVKKLVAKHNPIIKKEEIKKANGRSYATPKFKTIEHSADLKEVFEMTWQGAERGNTGYKGYTVIETWKADNFADMKEQVRVYLDSLMKVINAESYECQHCKGAGIIFETQETNKR